MQYDRDKHHRKSIRLHRYDYASSGAYFVTICVWGGACLLGEVVDGEMHLNAWGQVAHGCWQGIPGHFPHVALDAFVVMPNHVHGIIVIQRPVGAQHAAPLPSTAPPSDAAPLPGRPHGQVAPGSLGTIVRSYKSAVTRNVNQLRQTPGARFWQRNYWEHIIRNQAAWDRIRIYIEGNPANWARDQLHPEAEHNPFKEALAREAE